MEQWNPANTIHIFLHGTSVPQTDAVTYLRLTLDTRITWHKYMQYTIQKTELYSLIHAERPLHD